jgi:excisionase family DNA binding protein
MSTYSLAPESAKSTTSLLVTIPEAARLLGVSRDHIYRLIKSRKLPFVDMGLERSMMRIEVSDIRALIASRKSLVK